MSFIISNYIKLQDKLYKGIMDIEIKKIIDLHKLDQQILEINENKGALPSIIKDQEEQINELESTFKNSENELKDITKKIDDFSIQSSEFNQKIEKYNDQIYSVKNNKEYEALLKEIDFLKSENDVVLKDLSDLKNIKKQNTDSIDDIKKQIEDITSKLKFNNEELKTLSAETQLEEKELEKNKNDLIKNIKNKNFLSSYNEGAQNMKLSPLSRGACGSCFSTLPPQFVLNVKKMEELHSCPSCGINLYWEE